MEIWRRGEPHGRAVQAVQAEGTAKTKALKWEQAWLLEAGQHGQSRVDSRKATEDEAEVMKDQVTRT